MAGRLRGTIPKPTRRGDRTPARPHRLNRSRQPCYNPSQLTKLHTTIPEDPQRTRKGPDKPIPQYSDMTILQQLGGAAGLYSLSAAHAILALPLVLVRQLHPTFSASQLRPSHGSTPGLDLPTTSF